MRRDNLDTVWGGGAADALQARGELGARAKQAVEAGRLTVLSPYRIRSIARTGAALEISGALRGDVSTIVVDEMIVCTGFRPDLDDAQRGRVSVSIRGWSARRRWRR